MLSVKLPAAEEGQYFVHLSKVLANLEIMNVSVNPESAKEHKLPAERFMIRFSLVGC